MNYVALVISPLTGGAPYYEVRKLGSDGPIIEIQVKEKLWNFTSAKEVSNENIGNGAALKHEFPPRKERSHDKGFLVYVYGVITSFTHRSYLEASFTGQVVHVLVVVQAKFYLLT